MPSLVSSLRKLLLLWASVTAFACLGFASAQAQTPIISGTLSYTGSLGPINAQRPLCLCVYREPTLTVNPVCFITASAHQPYAFATPDTGNYYMVAFVDIHVNEILDPDEPFEIYRDRGLPPADAVAAGPGVAGIDFIFGDEHLPGAATATPTQTPTQTPTVRATCSGDCDDSGAVSLDEIELLLDRALGNGDTGACSRADSNLSSAIEIEEVVTAVNQTASCAGS